MVRKKIDRAMGNWAFKEAFPKALAVHLDPIASDQHLILLHLCYKDTRTPKAFKYEAVWASHPDFKTLEGQCWAQGNFVEQDKIWFLVSQLDRCSKMLRKWSKVAFPNNRKRIDVLKCQLEEIKAEIYTEGSVKRMNDIMTELEILWDREEKYWWQRAKVNWLTAGDCNTHYFHACTIQRRCRNLILKLKNETDQWVDSEEEVKKVVVNFYSSLFQTSGERNLDIVLNFVPTKIIGPQNSLLCREVTRQEVKEAAF